MSFLSSILPIVGGIAGSFVAPGVGTAIGAGLGSALGGALSSNDAASAQTNASNQAQNTQWQMFQQNKQDLSPWLQSGQQGNALLMQLLGIGGPQGSPTFNANAPLVKPFDGSNFQTDPSYQWRLGQGENALLNKASALGGLGGGNTMKALNDYAQGAASQEYSNAFNRYNTEQGNLYNRIAGLSNTGANAAAGIAGLGANTANNVSGLQYATGQAQAGNALAQQNAITGGLGGGLSNWLYANALQQGGQQNTYYGGVDQVPLNSGLGFDPASMYGP